MCEIHQKKPKNLHYTVKRLFLGAIYTYQRLLSPILGQSCRFSPTCSHYAVQAIEKYGVWVGGWLMVKRLLKCHPWHPGGIDHVP